METIELKNDIKVFCVTADSYPEGIMDAHQRLHKLVPFQADRNYFGVSRPENGGDIVYRACAEEKTEGEAQRYNCNTLVLEKGKYISIVVNDFDKNPHLIAHAFQELLAYPGIDPEGYCVEWYSNKMNSVKCMVRLAGK
jgi:hypothetical protein